MPDLGVFPCGTATGTNNAITLTVAAPATPPGAYANFMAFNFTVAATNTGATTIKVGTLAVLNVYHSNGVTQVGAGEFLIGTNVEVVYNSAVNSGAGGFVVINGVSLAPSLVPDVVPNVLMYGADPTGHADSSPAFNNALAANSYVFVPAGTYKCNSTININSSDVSLMGAGPGVTVIQSTTTNTPVINVSAAALNLISIANLSLTRTMAPTTTAANGLQFSAPVGNAFLSNIRVTSCWCGFSLGTTAWSVVESCIANSNFSHGFYLNTTNTPSTAALQWIMSNTQSEGNGTSSTVAHGYYVTTTSVGTTTATVAMIPWVNVGSFSNTGNGARFAGSAKAPLGFVAINGGNFSFDNSDSIYLDTFSTEAATTISEVYMEEAGQGATGISNQQAPKSNVGNGINATANNRVVKIDACRVAGVSQNGYSLNSTSVSIVNSHALDIGFATPGTATYSGIYIGSNPTDVIISSCKSGNLNANSALHGATITNGAVVTLVGNDFTQNVGKSVNFTVVASESNVTAYGNLGYVTDASNFVSFPALTGSVTVTHGLAAPAAIILLTPQGTPDTYYISSNGTTTFIISRPNTASSSGVCWRASTTTIS